MEYTQADILFALYIIGGEAPLDWLVGYFCEDTAPGSPTMVTMKEHIKTFIANDMLKINTTREDATVLLTEKGTLAALAAADIISEQVVTRWQSGPDLDRTAS